MYTENSDTAGQSEKKVFCFCFFPAKCKYCTWCSPRKYYFQERRRGQEEECRIHCIKRRGLLLRGRMDCSKCPNGMNPKHIPPPCARWKKAIKLFANRGSFMEWQALSWSTVQSQTSSFVSGGGSQCCALPSVPPQAHTSSFPFKNSAGKSLWTTRVPKQTVSLWRFRRFLSHLNEGAWKRKRMEGSTGCPLLLHHLPMELANKWQVRKPAKCWMSLNQLQNQHPPQQCCSPPHPDTHGNRQRTDRQRQLRTTGLGSNQESPVKPSLLKGKKEGGSPGSPVKASDRCKCATLGGNMILVLWGKK